MGGRNKQSKYYVVWSGRNTGVYDTWEKCRNQVFGFEGAVYKSFSSLEEANNAFLSGLKNKVIKNTSKKKVASDFHKQNDPILDSISVDGGGNNLTGFVEYRCVHTKSRQLLFERGPFEGGSNNLVEFLAIVHALAFCKTRKINLPIYSDSKTALVWVNKKKIKTTVEPNETNKKIFEYIEQALKWLNTNTYSNQILKWDTLAWGEIPADYGRK